MSASQVDDETSPEKKQKTLFNSYKIIIELRRSWLKVVEKRTKLWLFRSDCGSNYNRTH